LNIKFEGKSTKELTEKFEKTRSELLSIVSDMRQEILARDQENKNLKA